MNLNIALSLIAIPLLLTACSGPQPVASIPDSGVTSSNGGGQRALGDIPNVGITNGRATEHALPRNSVHANSY